MHVSLQSTPSPPPTVEDSPPRVWEYDEPPQVVRSHIQGEFIQDGPPPTEIVPYGQVTRQSPPQMEAEQQVTPTREFPIALVVALALLLVMTRGK